MAFDLTSQSGQTFFYQIGSVITTIPWNRPSFQKIKAFFEDDSISHIIEKYNVHLTGGCLWDFNTWDIDLILIHDWNESTDWNLIEQDMNALNDAALNKHHILLDLTLFDKIDHSFQFPSKSELKEYNKGRNESEYECQRGPLEGAIFVKVGYIKKQVGNITQETDLTYNERKQPLTENYLYKNDHRGEPHASKIIQKILKFDESGKFIHYLNYKEFLSMDADTFYKIQNKRIF
jgi:hypothetical protein